MPKYETFSERKRQQVILYVVLAATIISVSGILLTRYYVPYGLIFWTLAIVGGTLFLLVRWHAGVTAYRCKECSQEFERTALRDFLSPHLPNSKYLKCPHCGKRTWATVLMKKQ